MNVYSSVPMMKRPSAVAVGFFDGIHLGHQKILRLCTEQLPKFCPTVFTFTVLKAFPPKKNSHSLLITQEEKYRRLSALGIKNCIAPPFEDICHISAEDFIKKMMRSLKCNVLLVGSDFRFGRSAEGDVTLLKQICRKQNIQLYIVPIAYYHEIPVHTSAIKQALFKGNIQMANAMLGAPYGIYAVVEKGKQLGRLLGAPTINQRFDPCLVIPKYGVYSSVTMVNEKKKNSITFIGVKPTVSKENLPIAETHILDFDGDLYGKKIRVNLLDYLRGECRFKDMESLKNQIAKDKRLREMMV